MTDELVKRHIEQLRLTGGDLADLCQPLADAIDALTAERDGLLRCVTDNHVALCRAEKAEAERDRLQKSLTDAGVYLDQGLDKMAFNIIRAALKGETP